MYPWNGSFKNFWYPAQAYAYIATSHDHDHTLILHTCIYIYGYHYTLAIYSNCYQTCNCVYIHVNTYQNNYKFTITILSYVAIDYSVIMYIALKDTGYS